MTDFENLGVTVLKIGDEFKLFKEKAFSPVDGSYFEALEENAGFVMATYLGGMTPEEMFILSHMKIHARMIRNGNKILFLNRYGNTDLIFEVSFDPTLYDNQKAMQIAFDNHMVSFVGIERYTNQIKTLRQANFPMKLKQALITAWTSAYEQEKYSAEYSQWVESHYQYNLIELWDIAEDVGTFGESGVFEWSNQ